MERRGLTSGARLGTLCLPGASRAFCISRVFRAARLLGLSCLFAVLCFAAGPVGLDAQQLITSLPAVRAVSNADAARQLPVAFEGTVTYYEKGNVDLFVQDGDKAIYVQTSPDLQLTAGDRVLVDGITRPSFRPEIVAQHVTVLGHGSLPAAVNASFGQMIRAELDCRRATVRAVVRAANFYNDGARKSLLLDLSMPGGPIKAQVASGGTKSDLLPLLDSTVEITGAVAGTFDKKDRMTGILLEVPSFSDIRIVTPASRSPRQLAPRKFDQILPSMEIDDSSERVRVEGTITYYQPGSALVLQDGSDALWVDTSSEEPHAVGSHVLVSGFPSVRNGLVVLTRGEIEDAKPAGAAQTANLDAAQLIPGSHAFELVSVEGELVMRVREAAQDQYVIAAGGHVFSAIYRHPEPGLDLPVAPMRDVRLGSRVRVTGICVLDRGDQFRGPAAFHLLLRSPDDLGVLGGPSLISVRNLVILLSVLVIVVLGVVARSLLLERKLRRQEAAKATLIERWRTRVIDGINAAVPLRSTLSQITELLAFKLQVEFSWVELSPDAVYGNRPELEGAGLDAIGHEIPGRTGAPLGKIWVAYRTGSRKRRIAADAFENAVRLSALAIETGARYSELVRRSEVDAVTNTQNRFAFDRALELLVEKHRQSFGKLGLIYIDLDGFKLVNDQYGHQTGDRFLQETAARLGQQLRPQDVLARIGGDEFAVLVADVKSRDEVNEIALRLERCFAMPVRLDGAEIEAAASVGYAMYPEDATTGPELLECADAGMYREKRKRARMRMRESELTS